MLVQRLVYTDFRYELAAANAKPLLCFRWLGYNIASAPRWWTSLAVLNWIRAMSDLFWPLIVGGVLTVVAVCAAVAFRRRRPLKVNL